MNVNNNDDFEYENDNENDYEFNMNFDNDNDNDNNEIIDADEIEERLSKNRGNPRQIGKHSLKHDTVFRTTKQKKKEQNDFEYGEHIIELNNNEFNIIDELNGSDDENDTSSINYYRTNELKKQIRYLLETYTEVKMEAKKRKPSPSDFNSYFNLCLKELNDYGYNKYQIFIELAGYFTIDNYWNIFLLLEKKYADMIIKELEDKTGLTAINYLNDII